MAEEAFTRKLAAILYMDVAGYSRLTRADEVATHRALSASLDATTSAIEGHGGKVLHYAGDAILAEFASVVEAVDCAAGIQRELAARNHCLAEERKLQFRIGVNLGDVIVDRDELYGEGVNVAARLESLADPGGICISRKVLQEVRDKLEVGYEFVGEQTVKNIEDPIPVYRVLMEPETAGVVIGEDRPRPGSRTPVAVAFGVVTVVLLAGLGFWRPWEPATPSPSVSKQALPISAKPTIAVLPFDNMSNDKEQEYFSDGLTEDLITDISKVSGVRVIARNSTFSYKGKSLDVRAVGKDLGATHIVEGSVRKVGGTVRITVQLIDASDGSHIWAERYDRELKDIFAVQDEVIGQIVAVLSVKLTPDEKARIARKGTDNLEAYDLLIRGRQQESFFNKAAYVEAVELYQRAIALDRRYADAYAHLSIIHVVNGLFGWVENRDQAYDTSLRMAEKAVALDPSLPFAHYALGRALARPKFAEYDRAIEEFKKSIALDPSFADGYANLALVSVFTGNAAHAIGMMEKAMRINPHFPFWYYFGRGMARHLQGDYAAAVEDLSKAAERNPTVSFVRYWLAASLAQVGRIEDAEWQIEELHGMGYDMTLDQMLRENPVTFPAYRKKLIEGLRKAGFK